MKNLFKNALVLFCILLSLTYSSDVQSQQTLTQINGWNAYVHLPASYNSNNNTYPTIIFFPGIGEIGYNPAALISNGPGAYIAQGWNGNVQVDGNTVEFIVISVQPPSGFPSEYFLNEKIETIKSQYRVNLNKLYLTGLSMGGWCSTTYVTGDPYGGPYTYASKIAAVVTVEGMRPDDNSPYPALFDNYANVGGRYLGFEQALDGRDTKTVVDRMNATRPGSAIHVLTNFGGGGHCCWNQFYGGQGVQPGIFLLDGKNQNLYEWMARQSFGNPIAIPPPPANLPPTVNAGANKSITLPTNSTTLTGTASDPDGTIASYQWSQISGPSNSTIANANGASTSVSNLIQGSYQYQLKVTDNLGATATATTIVTVNAAAVNIPPTVNAGANKIITLPTNSTTLNGNATDSDGTVVSYQWSKVSGPAGDIMVNGNSTVASILSLVAGTYQYQLKVTDNGGATATAVTSVTVNAAAVAPVVTVSPNQSLTLPVNTAILNGNATSVTGVASYAWTKLSGPAGGAINTPMLATTTLSALQEGTYQYQLKVTDNLGLSATATTNVVVYAAAQPTTVGCNTAAPVTYTLTQTGPGEIYRPNGSAWKGGDTIKITGTYYSVIEFNNIGGDPCRPLVIMPMTTVSTPVFRLKGDCRYIKIWGGKTQYGLKVTNGALAINLAHHIEVDNVECYGGNVGVYCKTDVTYDDKRTWYPNYPMTKFTFKNMYIHDVSGEGMYVGITQVSGLTVKSLYSGQDTTIIPNRMDSVEISNCIVERCEWDGIQLSNARNGNKIFNNTVRDYGTINMSSQQAGIIMGGNCSGDINNNTVVRGTGNGIQVFGYGVINIFNNTLDSCGYDGLTNSNGTTGQQTIYASDYINTVENNPKQTINVYGNAIDRPKTSGGIFITGYFGNSNPSAVYNNTFCVPNAPANWQSIYIKSYVAGSTNTNNTLNCVGTLPNIPPVAKAGTAQVVTLPTSTVTLTGSGTDADGTVAGYKWAQVTGPNQASIVSSTAATTVINNLVQGVYQFELTVTDNQGAFSRDSVIVTVSPAAVTLLPAVNPANTVNGLDYKYYEGSWNTVPAFNTLTPVKTGTSANFDISYSNKEDLFGFSFTGYINVPADGVYTFYTTSDDGSMLYIDDVLTVNNDGLHAAIEKSGSIGLKAGKHAITGLFFELTGGQVFSVGYSGAGLVKQFIPNSELYRVNTQTTITLLPAVNPANTVNGLDYKYYEGDWINLPNFGALTPVKTGTTANVDIALANRTSQFGFTFSGFVDVPADGQYTFHTTSDDGSMLYIDNVLIVNNDGLHAALEKSGTIGLKAGKHAISALYFEQGGDHVFTVSYEGMGIAKKQIPSSALYRVSTTPAITLLPAVYPANPVLGLDYKYYEGTWNNMPNYTALNPLKTGTTTNFNISVANAGNLFGISFTGFISVPVDGQYNFYTTSDDGSMIYIDGVLVVNNDGLHGPQERSGTIGLKAGKHNITALYFDQLGNHMFYVGYDGPGITKVLVPSTSLFRDATPSFAAADRAGSATSANAIADGENALKAGDTKATDNAAAVYPNPFTSSFKVQLNDKAAAVYTLVLNDMSGKMILQKKVTKSAGPVVESIQASNLAPGTYILQIINANGMKTTHKLVKN